LRPQPEPPPLAQPTPLPLTPVSPSVPLAASPAESVAAPAEEPKSAESKAAPRRRADMTPQEAPVRDGTVSLAVTPWGEVFVNGVGRGVSPPLTKLSLPPGTHTIEVRNNASPPFIARVELRSGESISLQHRF
jgi:serine/threonine-protein kinase